jgi:hypothetical protein
LREEEGQDCKIGHATQGKTAKNDGKHKGRNICRTTGINIIEHNNADIITNSIPSIITGNITNHVKRNVTITKEEISRRKRVDKNLQDIIARMQQTGQVLTAAGSALLKSIKPDQKYR